MQRLDPETPSVPVARAASYLRAGFPSPAQDYWAPPVDLTRVLIDDAAATFLARVSGDSMTGAGVYDGDVVVVDRGLDANFGDIVVAVVDGDFTVKRLAKDHGRPVLRAENDEYPDIEVGAWSDARIWGVVTWSLHHLAGKAGSGVRAG
jgi:DNA polymerase V